ncbi:MAG: hypothetical protein WBG80_15165, partial [Bacteroidota bacterium]
RKLTRLSERGRVREDIEVQYRLAAGCHNDLRAPEDAAARDCHRLRGRGKDVLGVRPERGARRLAGTFSCPPQNRRAQQNA